MSVEITDNTARRRFEVLVDGELAALVTYGRNARQIALTHTESEPGFEGQGYAKKVVEYALATARDSSLEVLPFCPYVRDYIAAHPDELALVPVDQRAKFGLTEVTS
jgi:uncharacterized protein